MNKGIRKYPWSLYIVELLKRLTKNEAKAIINPSVNISDYSILSRSKPRKFLL